MSSNVDNGLSQLSGLFQSFSDTFGEDSSVYGDPVSDSLASTLSLSVSPHQAFWKTRPPKRDAFNNLVNRLSDQRRSQPLSEESRFPISDMYSRSKSTMAAVSEGLVEGMLSSDEFVDSGPCGREFLELEEYCIYGSLYLESCFIYCTPPNPHVTIITIQPQHGRPGRLVLTELYTSMYWACRYAKRGKKFTSLPIRVVSICDNKARFLSANFSQGYLRYLARIKAIKGLPVTTDINVGPYYDMDKPEDFRQFMRKLADVPICPPVYGS